MKQHTQNNLPNKLNSKKFRGSSMLFIRACTNSLKATVALCSILLVFASPLTAEARMRKLSDQELAHQVTPFMIVPQAVVDALQASGKASDLEALEALKKYEELFLKNYFRDDITAGGIETITSRVERFDFERNAWVVDVTTQTKVAHVLVTTEHGGSIQVTNIDVLSTTTFSRH